MVAVKSTVNQKLLGFVCGIPVTCKLNGQKVKSVYINFLVVHKKLRDKRLAPKLIDEVKRRIALTNVYTAIYTSGSMSHTPFGNMQFWHKQLNINKNIEVGYAELPKGTTLSRYVKQFKIPPPNQSDINGTPRLMIKKDIAQVFKLYNKEMEKRSNGHFVYS